MTDARVGFGPASFRPSIISSATIQPDPAPKLATPPL